ncbi:MAG TPA: hypothetical protein VLA77_01635 [Candidatus Saccharimonadales bacterium]|nr:hypothetical protein [Candidatus Saccharimonadales bacterium]
MADKRQLIKESQPIPREQWRLDNWTTLSDKEQRAFLISREHAELIKHRGYWSFSLIGIVIAINIVSLAVVILIGLGRMQFNGDLAVPSIITANFVQTWALTKIAMKFYFSDDKKS